MQKRGTTFPHGTAHPKEKIMKFLQIALCLAACVSAAAVIPLAVFFEYYCLIAVAAAFLFAGGMMAVKRARTPKPPQPSFMNSDEENARINAYLKEHKDE